MSLLRSDLKVSQYDVSVKSLSLLRHDNVCALLFYSEDSLSSLNSHHAKKYINLERGFRLPPVAYY